jgi:hypothetical protein
MSATDQHGVTQQKESKMAEWAECPSGGHKVILARFNQKGIAQIHGFYAL